jgi:hypothetical protein
MVALRITTMRKAMSGLVGGLLPACSRFRRHQLVVGSCRAEQQAGTPVALCEACAHEALEAQWLRKWRARQFAPVWALLVALLVACGGISTDDRRPPPESAGAAGEASAGAGGVPGCVEVDVEPSLVCPRPPCVPIEGSPDWCEPVPQAVFTCSAPPDPATCNPATRSGRANAWCCW